MNIPFLSESSAFRIADFDSIPTRLGPKLFRFCHLQSVLRDYSTMLIDAATLEDVVELYSDHLLSKFPSLTLPGEKEKDPDGESFGPPDALTAEQKKDLVAFLKRL